MMHHQENKRIRITIERLTPEGLGVGYHEGKITFVPGWLPGETGLVEIRENKKNWQRANPVQLEHESKLRIEAPCTVFGRCGGCQLQHLPYAETLKYKQQWVQEALARIGKLEAEVSPVIGMNDPWRYRNKAKLHHQKGRLGYYQSQTNALIRFEDCLLLSIEMNRWIKQVEGFLSENCVTDEPKTITVRQNQVGDGLILFERIPIEIEEETASMQKLLRNNEPLEGSSEFYSFWGTDEQGELKHILGRDALTVKIASLDFTVSPLAFLQVNPLQTEVLYRQIIEWAQLTGIETVWDLYCGIGTISLALARQAGFVYGIEVNPHAVADATKNAQLNNIQNATFIAGKAEEECEKILDKPDLVVLDPPRAGAERKLLEAIIQLQVGRVIYSSCDFRTLARDLAILVAGGYRIAGVQPVDMFPWTEHVETVVLMSRKDK